MSTQAIATTRERAGLYFVFDGPPSHESGRFVEVEDQNGKGVGPDTTRAEWREEGHLWSLGPFAPVSTEGGLQLTDRERAALHLIAKERMVDRSGAAWVEPLLDKFTELEWACLATKLALA
jgi:hypothetical protein